MKKVEIFSRALLKGLLLSLPYQNSKRFMVVFPNAKINIGLEVIRKRPDGYHDLETIFYPLSLCDILEIVPSDKFHFSTSGLPVDSREEDNLVVKAYQQVKEAFDLPSVSIHLHKVIPMGAGLGGGSSDGAFTLKVLNELFALKLPIKALIRYASNLGSDCPFFLLNKPVFAGGKGDVFSDVQINLSNYKIVLVKPGFAVSTELAYKSIIPQKPEHSLAETVKKMPGEWKDIVVNRFEERIFPYYPEISEIKEKLARLGALYTSMSGSGSSVFGIFDEEKASLEKEFPGFFYWEETGR